MGGSNPVDFCRLAQIAIRVPKLAYTLWNIASHFFVCLAPIAAIVIVGVGVSRYNFGR